METYINNTDKEYFRLLETILRDGRTKHNRTGTNTVGIFGEQAKFTVNMDAFPILTTKKVWFKGIVHELLWFLRGDTNIKYLVDNDVHIWDEWAYKQYADAAKKNFGGNVPYSQYEFIQFVKEGVEPFTTNWGNLGEGTYGGMWRAFPYHRTSTTEWTDENGPNGFVDTEKGTVDQIQKVINKLKNNPDDRRMIVSAWHPYWVDHCALPPCHCMFHFNTEELTLEERQRLLHTFHGRTPETFNGQGAEKECDYYNIPRRRLNLLLYQRSCDSALGVPFNITSYSLLLALMAHCVNMIPGEFVHTYGDLHIYENHLNGVKEQLQRTPMKLPKLWLNPDVKSLFDFKYEDIKLIDYKSHPTIKFDVAV